MAFLGLFSPGNFGLPELIIILVIVLLLFGAKKLPDLAKSLGRSVGEFKKGKQEGEKDEPSKTSGQEENKPPAAEKK